MPHPRLKYEVTQLLHQGKRMPLFNAVASRLSPLQGMDKASPDCPQIDLIVGCLGAPKVDDFKMAETDGPTKAYLDSIREKVPQPTEGASLEERFPLWSKEDMDFVKSNLQYDPHTRPTASEMMKSPYFDCIREKPEIFGNFAEMNETYVPAPFDGIKLEYTSLPTLKHLIEGIITEEQIEGYLDTLMQDYWDQGKLQSYDGLTMASPELHTIEQLKASTTIKQKLKDYTEQYECVTQGMLNPSILFQKLKAHKLLEKVLVTGFGKLYTKGTTESKARKEVMKEVQKAMKGSTDVAGCDAALQKLGFDFPPDSEYLLETLLADIKKGKTMCDYGELIKHIEWATTEEFQKRPPPEPCTNLGLGQGTGGGGSATPGAPFAAAPVASAPPAAAPTPPTTKSEASQCCVIN